MRILLGAQMKSNESATAKTVKINKSAQFTVEEANKIPIGDGKTDAGENHLPDTAPSTYKWINFTQGTRGQVDANNSLADGSFAVDDRVRIFWTEEAAAGNEAAEANMLVISPNRFPGTLETYSMSSLAGNKKMLNIFGELLEAAS